MAAQDFRDTVEEKGTSGVGVYVWLLLLIAIFGPFALGILGAALKSLNDFFGLSPVGQGGVIAALHWAPILVYVTWPIAAFIVLVTVVLAIVKGISQRGNQK